MDTSNEQAEDMPEADSPRPKRGRGEKRQGGRSGGKNEPGPMELALRRFQACGRCSYFVADLQIYLGRDTIRAAIEDGSGEWLTVEWADVLRRLARESYIADDDVFYYYYDGTCPECRRRYTYLSEADEDEQPLFRLQY
jgi:hypothetical protein